MGRCGCMGGMCMCKEVYEWGGVMYVWEVCIWGGVMYVHGEMCVLGEIVCGGKGVLCMHGQVCVCVYFAVVVMVHI